MISKWFAVILSAVLMLLCIFDIDAADVAIYAGCSIANRLLYPFFHANILHCLFNVYCLLSLVFLSGNTIKHFIVAYIIAVLFPIDSYLQFSDSMELYTVGLSGVLFVMLGRFGMFVSRFWFYQLCAWLYLIVGLFIPQMNGILHLHCYIAGIIWGILTKPFKYVARNR